MQRQRILSILGLLFIGLASQKLHAFEPCVKPYHWTVRYWIHETPADPNSPVAFKIKLSLVSAAGDCTATGWEIAAIEIRQVDPNGGSDQVWTQNDPEVSTADGLWWINHADVSDPQSSEFVLPPHLMGIATAQDPNDADLRYELEGVTYRPPEPPGEAPYAVTAATNFELWLVGDPTPIKPGSDEPTETDPPMPS
jgi:hypothetical protein